MISITKQYDFLCEMQQSINNDIAGENWVLSDGVWVDDDHWIDTGKVNTKKVLGRVIDHVLVSPTEAHLIKKLSDRQGIVLAVKMPDADAEIESKDEYLEHNHQLIFLLEKIDPASVTTETERAHYAKMQKIMSMVKEYFLRHGQGTVIDHKDERLSKPFHTEWEYQAFGGWNGLSVSFDMQDYSL